MHTKLVLKCQIALTVKVINSNQVLKYPTAAW